jgi:hypothetical protein
MRKITLDAETRSKLAPGAEEIELCDERGITLGYYVPADEFREMMYAWAQKLFDEAEVERARRETGGYTTAEALAELESRFPQLRRGA